ncbi:MAG TPA: thiamine pyrophosphate-binding protein [Candidatus Limnocylindrales bacterium]|nr:thiamine pyrophosphate-binding protein [Candidatus Limnocylindrales bacterium]
MRVVDAVASWMSEIGITHYFGYAGGAMWPFLDALVDHPEMDGIQAKIEGNAVHAADIYYRTTGRIAPVIVTKGPGLLNCVGGIATAMHDTSALLVIAGAGSTHFAGKGGMQEIYYKGHEDALNVLRPVTKGVWMAIRPDHVIDILNTAYKTAITGRPGPVFVQLPFDVQLGEVEGEIEGAAPRLAVTRPRADRESVAKAAELLAEANKPVILAGGGLKHSRGADASLRTFVERFDVPVVTTLPAKGILSEDHPLSAGVVGRSGTFAAAQTTREADLVVALGARFSDNHTSNWRQGKIYDVPRTKIVQVDLDVSEIARNYPVAVGVQADAGSFLDDLAEAYGARPAVDRSAWVSEVQGYRAAWREEIQPLITAEGDGVHPARLVHELGEAMGTTGRVFIDVGDVIQYAEAYMTIRGTGQWHINPGMAEMGWASSGVVGAVVADRSRPAIALTGDGAFNMVSNVLATAVEYDLPAIWVILNNHELGIERKGATAAFKRVHPWYEFRRRDTGELYNPDYVKLAEANGALGEVVARGSELRPALERALASGRPYVLDVRVDLSVPTYFTKGLDRAYPDKWGESYPGYGLLKVAR